MALGLCVLLGLRPVCTGSLGPEASQNPESAQDGSVAKGSDESFSASGEAAEPASTKGSEMEPQQRQQILESLMADAASSSCYETAGPLEAVAQGVLLEQQEQGAQVAHGGYLDLFGNYWSCITWTGDEVTLTFVRDRSSGDEEACQVTQVRLDRKKWEELCGA